MEANMKSMCARVLSEPLKESGAIQKNAGVSDDATSAALVATWWRLFNHFECGAQANVFR
jgi:hypothetical protein